MAEIKQVLTNPKTAKLYKHNGNWSRKINIPGVWSGPVQDIPPHAVEKLIEQGRKDFTRIKGAKLSADDDGEEGGDPGGDGKLSGASENIQP